MKLNHFLCYSYPQIMINPSAKRHGNVRAIHLFLAVYSSAVFSQNLPSMNAPTVGNLANPSLIDFAPKISNKNSASSVFTGLNNSQQTQSLVNETDRLIKLQAQQERDKANASNESHIYYNLPLATSSETQFYHAAYDQMMSLNLDSYSISDVNFLVENAYFNNTQSYAEFQNVIHRTGEFLRTKMKEMKYDTNSNLAKNYILFQFFSEKMKLKVGSNEHLPFKYDFVDYMGQEDWSKMFVSKLLATGSGQCHSLPLLYLMLAEEIGAEAYLSLSPNHTYIKFPDDDRKWHNVELTNAMFTTNSFILDSGFIKAEALQSKIFMQNLDRTQLLSEFYADLAAGYVHKFGYDGFVEKVVLKALELYPENITANMLLSNYYSRRFEYVMKQFHIDPTDRQDLQRIRNFPKAISLLKVTQAQYQKIDNLGFELMPLEAYEKWLHSLQDAKQKQDNDIFQQQVKGVLQQKIKN